MDAKVLLTKAKVKTPVLDKKYTKHINSLIQNFSEEDEARWELYGLLIQEICQLNNDVLISEIKYRLTDGDEPNDVFLSVLNKISDSTDGLMWIVKKRLEEYSEEDFFKRFYP